MVVRETVDVRIGWLLKRKHYVPGVLLVLVANRAGPSLLTAHSRQDGGRSQLLQFFNILVDLLLLLLILFGLRLTPQQAGGT